MKKFTYGSFYSDVDGFAQVLNRMGGECVIASKCFSINGQGISYNTAAVIVEEN